MKRNQQGTECAESIYKYTVQEHLPCRKRNLQYIIHTEMLVLDIMAGKIHDKSSCFVKIRIGWQREGEGNDKPGKRNFWVFVFAFLL